MVSVALVCKLKSVERTTVWIVTMVVRWRYCGKRYSRLRHFLIKAQWDFFFNTYQPKYDDEGILCFEDGRSYGSVENYIESRLHVPYGHIKVIKIKQLCDKNLTT